MNNWSFKAELSIPELLNSLDLLDVSTVQIIRDISNSVIYTSELVKITYNNEDNLAEISKLWRKKYNLLELNRFRDPDIISGLLKYAKFVITKDFDPKDQDLFGVYAKKLDCWLYNGRFMKTTKLKKKVSNLEIHTLTVTPADFRECRFSKKKSQFSVPLKFAMEICSDIKNIEILDFIEKLDVIPREVFQNLFEVSNKIISRERVLLDNPYFHKTWYKNVEILQVNLDIDLSRVTYCFNGYGIKHNLQQAKKIIVANDSEFIRYCVGYENPHFHKITVRSFDKVDLEIFKISCESFKLVHYNSKDLLPTYIKDLVENIRAESLILVAPTYVLAYLESVEKTSLSQFMMTTYSYKNELVSPKVDKLVEENYRRYKSIKSAANM